MPYLAGNITPQDFGALGNGSNDDTSAINLALAFAAATGGAIVQLPQGTYKTTGPILAYPGVSLRGPCGSVQAAVGSPDIGAVIKPAGSWATTLPVSGAITIIDVTSLGTANTPQYRADVRDVWIDGSSGPAGLDGIASWGAMKAVLLRNIGIASMTGRGIGAYKNTNFTSSNAPTGWDVDTVLIQNTGSDGLLYPGTDATLFNVHAQMLNPATTTGDGIKITGAHCQLIGCRGDQYQNGITIDVRASAAPNGMDTTLILGGGTQNNQKNGLNVINSSATGQSLSSPLSVTGAHFDGDGQNSGAGGGGYAGIAVSGVNTVSLVNCCVWVSTGNVSGGCPQYALATASSGSGPGTPDTIAAEGGFWNSVNALLVNDAGPASSLRIAPTVQAYAGGQWQRQSSTPLQPYITPAFAGPVQENFNHPVAGVVAATMPRTRATTAQLSMTSGTLYVVEFGMQAGTKVSTATAFTNTTAKLGGTHGWYVILDANRKVIAVTADQTDPATVWGATNTGYPINFSAPAIAQYSGSFYFGIMVAATTMPVFSGAPGVAGGVSGGAGITSPVILAGTSSTGLTTPPAVGATMGALTSQGTFLPYAYFT